ncbi:MAG: hypothetical protein Q4P32_08760, partial [Micrococcales bacterium]|nr:hypothetical protein [Micrococcales bacterium]
IARIVERFGLGRSGQGRESLDAFVDEMASRTAKDWLAMARGHERARHSVLRAIRVAADGSWVRRPTAAGLRQLIDLNLGSFIAPGRELLEATTIPVWALQPEEGDYDGGFAAFSELAQQRPGWSARTLEGGMHVVHTHREEVLEQLRSLLETLPD